VDLAAEAAACAEAAEAEAEAEAEVQSEQEASSDDDASADAADSDEEGAAADAEGGPMEEESMSPAIIKEPPTEQLDAASGGDSDDGDDDDKSVTSSEAAETQGFFGGSLPPSVHARVLLPQGKGVVFAVEGTNALVALDNFQWDNVDVSKMVAWGQTAGQLNVDFSATPDRPEVHAVLVHNRQGKPEAYLTGPSTRPNGTEWRLFACLRS
jgi:hypothetical protein